MASLIQLPTEIRQQILTLALPYTSHIDSFKQVLQLFHINRRLRSDMGPVIDVWSPMTYVYTPSELSRSAPRPLNWRLDRICLDLFHESERDRIGCTCYCLGESKYSHHELIAAWADAVSLLPKNVKQLWLDVTPAPTDRRTLNQFTLRRFVHNKCAAKVFLGCHVQDVAALIKSIERHYDGSVQVALTGTLSTHSTFFVDSMSEEIGRQLEFVGSWVAPEDARFEKISDAVLRLTSAKRGWPGKKRGEKHRLVWLRDVVWMNKTKFLFARLAKDGLEATVMEDVRRMAEFRADEGKVELALPSSSSLRRAFQHSVAADLGLKTASDGVGEDRHVVVSS